MSDAPAPLRVGVVVERRASSHPWVDALWRPLSVMHGEASAAPWTLLAEDDETATFYAGATEIELHPTEAARYRDNLASGEPALWVVLRPTGVEPPFDLICVTADPDEAEGLTSAGSDMVERVAMPDGIRETLEAYVERHYVERPFFKRQRDRVDPQALARRPRGRDEP